MPVDLLAAGTGTDAAGTDADGLFSWAVPAP